jgi:hypothetical protein
MSELPQTIERNGRNYHRCEGRGDGIHYAALDEENAPVILCKCGNDSFQIAYRYYECVAVCKCGNRFTIYDG